MKKLLTCFFIILFLLGLLILFISFKMFVVSGNSMEPTLNDGEKILVNKLAYLFSKPQRGDLVLVNAEGKTWVKRIVGLPDEQIEIKDGGIKINNKILYESYIKEIHTYGDQRTFLAPGQFYVLGDNREPNQSVDSRILGPVSLKNILGKVVVQMSPNFKFLRKVNYQFGY